MFLLAFFENILVKIKQHLPTNLSPQTATILSLVAAVIVINIILTVSASHSFRKYMKKLNRVAWDGFLHMIWATIWYLVLGSTQTIPCACVPPHLAEAGPLPDSA